ncbi:hypothetical protein MCHI_003838 [Candidatus Magnetoovum chiemensis]|nr:hypothetical protein MCHI_003838 [Candidatus Magnetoovum chiemensis]
MTSNDLVDGSAGKALDFDGSNDGITKSDNAALDIGTTTDLTIEALVKPDSIGSQVLILQKRGTSSPYVGYHVFLQSSGVITGAARGSGDPVTTQTNSSSALSTSSYTYVAVAYDRDGNIQVYINGEADGGYVSMSSVANMDNSGSLEIAYPTHGSAGNFNGIIDEIRISTTLRSSAWIKASSYAIFDNLINYGSFAQLTLPPIELNGSLVFGEFGDSELTLPSYTITAASIETINAVTIELLMLELTSKTPPLADIIITPSEFKIKAAGSGENILKSKLALPKPATKAAGKKGNINTANIKLTSPNIYAQLAASAALTLPTLELLALLTSDKDCSAKINLLKPKITAEAKTGRLADLKLPTRKLTVSAKLLSQNLATFDKTTGKYKVRAKGLNGTVGSISIELQTPTTLHAENYQSNNAAAKLTLWRQL